MGKNIKLVSESVLLRPYHPDDAVCVFEASRESVAEAGIWMPWCHADYSMEESSNWIKTCGEAWDKASAYEFAIVDSQNGRYFGGCGLNHIDSTNRIANLGYWVRSSLTRRGLATAAAVLLARFGLAELHLNRIEIVAAVGNRASQHVAEKAGAKREGILRNRILINGTAHDAVIFSFIPQDLALNIDR